LSLWYKQWRATQPRKVENICEYLSMVYLFVKCDGFMSSFEEHSVGTCGILGTVYTLVLEYSVYSCFLCLKHMFINLEKKNH
jgi:hypothetical protein